MFLLRRFPARLPSLDSVDLLTSTNGGGVCPRAAQQLDVDRCRSTYGSREKARRRTSARRCLLTSQHRQSAATVPRALTLVRPGLHFRDRAANDREGAQTRFGKAPGEIVQLVWCPSPKSHDERLAPLHLTAFSSAPDFANQLLYGIHTTSAGSARFYANSETTSISRSALTGF